MAKKLRVKIVASDAVTALREARERLAKVGKWPKRLGESPIGVIDEQLEVAEEEFERLDNITDNIDEYEHIDVYQLDDGFEVAIDLVDMFLHKAKDATVLAGLIRDLLQLARNLVAYEATVYVGVGIDKPAKALQELRRAAKEHRIKLPSAPLQDDDAERDDVGGDDDDSVDFGDAEDAAASTGSSSRSKGNQWGGLDENAVKNKSPLSDSEEFFLKCAGVDWPCTAERLKAEFRRMAQMTHPDKQHGNAADKATAAAMFKLMKEGHDSLEKRLNGT